MTRAAVYARYSSEGQREASITDQYRNCERWAEREGATIDYHYKDEALSGSTDARQRPGYRALLEDAKAKRFDIVLVDDLSRLSRDEAELILTRRKLTFYGVRLVGVSDGFDSAAKGHKIQATVRGMMNEMYLDDLREKTHRGLTGQALKGNHCGGRTYGYRHVPQYHPTTTDQYGLRTVTAVTREPDPEQARWVLQIFEWYAAGQSPRWIAGELNRLGIPAPSVGWRRRAPNPTWSASSLHGDPKQYTGLLHNPLYIGRVVWNRRQWVRNPETKRKVPVLRPESEWIVTEVPTLRIVPQALWERVQARRTVQAQAYSGEDGKRRTGRSPKYLLSGLLKCGNCDANFIMADYYRYRCASHLNRGQSVCTNALQVPRALVEDRVLTGLKRDLFSPDCFALFQRETTRLLAERLHAPSRGQDAARTRLAVVEHELTHVMRAIKAGVVTATTKAELEKLEGERARLTEALEGGESMRLKKIAAFLPNAEARYRQLVANLERLSERYIVEARQEISILLGGVIRLLPTTEGYLEAHLTGHYAGLVSLAVGQELKNLVAGEGFEPSTFGL